MKKIKLILLLFIIGFSAHAQETRLNLYGGYVFDDNLDKFNSYDQYVNGQVKGGLQYGGSVEFVSPTELGIELMYIGQSTTLPLSFDAGFTTGPRTATNDLSLNYALVGINKYSRGTGKMEGYGGLMLGCLFSSLTNTGINDSLGNRYTGTNTSGTRFTWGLKLGANMWVKENIAIKMQAQFLSTSEAVGGSSYYGYYGSYNYYSYINMFQWSFSTGLVFRLSGSN